MDWRHRAACRDIDPELFFPVGDDGPAREQAEVAKLVCAGCPVREECGRWAMETGQDSGIWGGLTEDERRVMRRAAWTPPGARPRRPVVPSRHDESHRRRGRCTACGALHPLRADGTVGQHRRAHGACAGAGAAPRMAEAEQ